MEGINGKDDMNQLVSRCCWMKNASHQPTMLSIHKAICDDSKDNWGNEKETCIVWQNYEYVRS